MRNDPLHAAVQRVVSVRPDICSSAFEVFMFCLCLWRLASAPGVCSRCLLPVSASESVWPACSGARGVVPFGADKVPAEFCGLAKKSKFVSRKNVGSHETQILEHVAACAGPARFVLRREPSCASPSAPTAPRGAASGPSGSPRSSRSSRKTQKAEEAQKTEEGKEKPPRPGAAGGWKASLRLSLRA